MKNPAPALGSLAPQPPPSPRLEHPFKSHHMLKPAWLGMADTGCPGCWTPDTRD